MMLRARRLAVFMLMPLALVACDDKDPSGPDALAAPTGVTAQSIGTTSIEVTWNAVAGASSYRIERAQGTGGFVAAGTSTSTTHTDNDLQPATAYRYRVAAVRGSEQSGFSAEATATTGEAGPKAATVTGNITRNRTFYSDTVYTLSGFVRVQSGATLTIQPGTLIRGDSAVAGSALFILPGAKINAVGTADSPIVFTSGRNANRRPGDWGGVVIVGRGIVNTTGDRIVEGSDALGSQGILYSGGTNNADNSGELRYVRIEFAGYAVAPNVELNSLTLAAVGSGTKLEYVQTLAGLDDSFEWFGGAVDGKYLVSYESGDDHFDMSEGYVGRLQHLIAYQTQVLDPRPGTGGISSDPQGMENDGCDGAQCAQGHASTPMSAPVVANFTLIGRGDAATMSSGGDIGMVLRRGMGGHYVNGVLGRWPRAAISVRDAQTQTNIANGDLTINNILVSESGPLFQPGQQVGVDSVANAIIRTANTTASLFASVPTQPATTAQIDWSLSANSPARDGGLNAFTGKLQTKAGTFVTPTTYRGAADPTGPKWWQGWTRYIVN